MGKGVTYTVQIWWSGPTGITLAWALLDGGIEELTFWIQPDLNPGSVTFCATVNTSFDLLRSNGDNITYNKVGRSTWILHIKKPVYDQHIVKITKVKDSTQLSRSGLLHSATHQADWEAMLLNSFPLLLLQGFALHFPTSEPQANFTWLTSSHPSPEPKAPFLPETPPLSQDWWLIPYTLNTLKRTCTSAPVTSLWESYFLAYTPYQSVRNWKAGPCASALSPVPRTIMDSSRCSVTIYLEDAWMNTNRNHV